MLSHSSQGAWVQRLHQKGPDPTNQSREVSVNYPGSIAWNKKSWFVTFGNHWQPRGYAILCSREQSAKSAREILLQCIIFQLVA
jgi:hypothetical protein